MAVEPLLGTNAQRFFLATVLLQAVVVLVMVGIVFHFVDEHVDLDESQQHKTIPCYLALFAFAEVFQIFMCVDALRLRNVIQLIGLLFFNVALIVFSSLQVHETHTALVTSSTSDCVANFSYVTCGGSGTLWTKVEPFLIVAPIVIAVTLLMLMFWFRALYSEFGWAIFHVVGANPKMKTMYQYYQVMICLLKFDFFCFVGVTMQLLILVLHDDSAEFGVTVAAIPIVLILLIGAGIAVQREIKWLMTTAQILMLAAETYFVYKLVRFYQPSSSSQYVSTRATLTTFTIVAFLILFLTFAVGLRCFSDFDKGLRASKTHELQTSAPKSPGFMGERNSSYMNGGAPLQQRLSIE